MVYQFQCKDCAQLLYFDNNVVSPNNRRIPLNVANKSPHQCPKRKFSIPCRDCRVPIYFDDARLSKNGKKIPLNASDGLPHDCLKREFGAKTWGGSLAVLLFSRESSKIGRCMNTSCAL